MLLVSDIDQFFFIIDIKTEMYDTEFIFCRCPL